MARSRALLIEADLARLGAAGAARWRSFHADPVPREGAFLMDRDRERLLALEAEPDLGPSLFLYRWARPTITLGYAQHEEEVLDGEGVRASGWPVVRRPTGGRTILHVEEWTWAAVVPIEDPRVGGSLRSSLLTQGEVIVEALRAIGVEAGLATGSGRHESGGSLTAGERACFAFAAGHEIVAGGRKLAGAAQRRLVRAALTQGTILVGTGHERLANVLRGTEESQKHTRRKLMEETVSLRTLGIADPSFEVFANQVELSWQSRAARD